MQPKAAKTTEDSKNRSPKNISTKNKSVSLMSVTLPRTSSQSNVSLKRDLGGSRSLCDNRQYQKYQRVNQRTCPFVSRLLRSNCNSPEPSIFGHSSRRQLRSSNGIAGIASDLKPAADGNKEYDRNSSKRVAKDNTSHPSPQDQPRNTLSRSLHCLWCDSYKHLQDRCKELTHAINTRKVLYNSKRIINAITGKEFAPRIGRG